MTVHIIGAGLAGLSTALHLQEAGIPVQLYEAAARPGGRCGGWSPTPDAPRRDRGTHLILSGNQTLCRLIHRYAQPEGWLTLPPRFRFHDLRDGTDWTIHPGPGRWPGWLLSPERRVAGLGISGHLRALLALEISRVERLGDAIDLSSLAGRRMIAPLAVALLNTPAADASLPLLRQTLRDSLYRGGLALSPLLCRTSLEADLISPLAQAVSASGGTIHLRGPVTALHHGAEGITLSGPTGEIACGQAPVVLAVDAPQAHRLLPTLLPDLPHSPILNLHYPISDSTPGQKQPALTGLCGGVAEWALRRPGHLAVTISAAAPEIRARTDLVQAVWQEVRQIHPDLPPDCPAQARLLTERRATLLQTAATDRLRPPARPIGPGWPKTLWLAGDWTQTGLPCTLEGAARSGRIAATAVLQHLKAGF